MGPSSEKSQLKRGRHSTEEPDPELKKPRRSERNQNHNETTPIAHKSHLPSPVTHHETSSTVGDRRDHVKEISKEATLTPPDSQPGSPPSDTQVLSQFIYPPRAASAEVEDEDAEGVWGYLIPLDANCGDVLVLQSRTACPKPVENSGFGRGAGERSRGAGRNYNQEEKQFEEEKREHGPVASGYLIGRHPECDRVISHESVSNRHCLIFRENKHGGAVAILEDLSSNGTFVNEALVGRNKRRELEEGDEISILGEARFIFRYSRNRNTNAFRQKYTIVEQLGKGHFAIVYLCVEKETGHRYAVKKFEKRPGQAEKTKTEGLHQEIAVLMSVSHPNMLCLKDTFDEDDGVYLVVELAPEGELFNWIVMRQKFTEPETRKVFIQLFQGVKYLHERNIVHRDIKPENILVVDKNLTVKLADFGLSKIIGEESFTTTLYVAPEILEQSNHRKYTKAVDVWSLGVVLYICLCGFPPFSDELYTSENPYTLAQQIKMGRFDYPSPYWDSVGDPALDLIDRMLTVDVEKRYTIEDCLAHPWITEKDVNPHDSTDGLTGALDGLDFSKRKVERQRTLLSNLNDVKVSRVIQIQTNKSPIKVYEKNPNTQNGEIHAPKEGPAVPKADPTTKEEAPAAHHKNVFEIASFGFSGPRRNTMGVFAGIAGPLANHLAQASTPVLVAAGASAFIVLSIVLNVLNQLLFKDPNTPPLVFHWIPFIGSTVTYGMEPIKFFQSNRAKYGDVFTFVLLGKKTTVCLGRQGNDLVLNGKLKDVNAEEIYSPLTTPVFGKDVVYDCPNSRLLEQKKFVKFGLTTEAFRSYVPLIVNEVVEYVNRSPQFQGNKGTCDVSRTMAEITIYTASRSLQGKEVRDRFDSSFADLYHDLDMGFTPINFMLPWAPLPRNRKRDAAHHKISTTYMEIIKARREALKDGGKPDSEDMIWNLMGSVYKDGTPLPDYQIAHMMIALLMAGQHSSSTSSAWIVLNLATRPEIIEELYQEQINVLGADLPDLTYENLQTLPLNAQVIKETLRLHSPIHSIMRKVKSPLHVEGTPYTIPTSHSVIASPGISARDAEHFPNPETWEPHRWDPKEGDSKPEEEEETEDYGYGLVSKGAKSPYLPFGAGRHRCIGEQFAYVQLGAILATLVRLFKLSNPDGVKGIPDTDFSSLFSKPAHPAIVRWEKRGTKA
ncbi:cytochrome P450 [Xylona heveae TC161]|uniref:Cytochrome P450 n=1 Tax=Xylona heveae (strain CBS 132557 / TC161) TaxID=1328760 RepID=A0A165K1U7_XYLHT|nr:cytochrome P450 [Xylona heveae TC161]KZF26892.1 cytochrome P450 [Xylona heveae TC161]